MPRRWQYVVLLIGAVIVGSVWLSRTVVDAPSRPEISLSTGPARTPTTPSSACPSLQAMVDQAAPGTAVTVPPCIYRETVTITKSLTLTGQPGAEIRGSDDWSGGWTQQGTHWIRGRVPWFSSFGECKPNTQRCLWPEQVFLDGQPLLQVSESPVHGQFAVNAAREVILADNPVGRLVEVTVRTHWIIGRAHDVTIQGFTMKHAANHPRNSGAISQNAGYNNWTLQDNVFSHAHGAIIQIGKGSGHRILRNEISFAGQLGIGGYEAADVLIQGNRIHDNNTEAFSQGWEAGGAKLVLMSRLTVDSNEVYNNDAPGIWCDIGCADTVIKNNLVHGNAKQGIVYEISHRGAIHGNKVWENGWDVLGEGWGSGIVCATCDNTEIFDNVVAWNGDGIAVYDEHRPDGQPVVENSVFRNTIILNDGWFTPTALGWFCYDNGAMYATSMNNRGEGNAYWYPTTETGTSPRFHWESTDVGRLSEFNATAGERDGRYLSDSEQSQLLSVAGIPLTPRAR